MELNIITSKIYEIRGQKVMLDFDLAELYGIETRALNQAVNRNIERFPEDFMFRINDSEYKNLKSQIVISSWMSTFLTQHIELNVGLLYPPCLKKRFHEIRCFICEKTCQYLGFGMEGIAVISVDMMPVLDI